MQNMKDILTKRIEIFSKSHSKILNLSNLGLGDEDLKNLADDLEEKKCIDNVESINLSRNSVTDETCKMLITFNKLKEINLASTHIGDSGIAILLDPKKNIKISKLDITDCYLSEKAGELLLKNITQFEQLNFSGNPKISEKTQQQIKLKLNETKTGTDKQIKSSSLPSEIIKKSSSVDVRKLTTLSFLSPVNTRKEATQDINIELLKQGILPERDNVSNLSKEDKENLVINFAKYLGIEVIIKQIPSMQNNKN